MLRSSISDPEAGPLVDGLAVRLDAALSELRELARGIHPAILTAQRARARRSPRSRSARRSPVRRRDGDRRPPVAGGRGGRLLRRGRGADQRRALRACAGGARARCAATATAIVVLVADDGVGGADLNAGSGLRGLQDRLAVVDGVLAIDSPPGAGTRLEARIPSAVTA